MPTDPLPTHREVVVWRFWLTNLLGWTEHEVLAFAERWRDGLLEEHSLHYHEASEYWISPQLVPREIREKYHPFIVERASWAIYPLLERYRRTDGLSMEHLPQLRMELQAAIDRRMDELSAAWPEV